MSTGETEGNIPHALPVVNAPYLLMATLERPCRTHPQLTTPRRSVSPSSTAAARGLLSAYQVPSHLPVPAQSHGTESRNHRRTVALS